MEGRKIARKLVLCLGLTVSAASPAWAGVFTNTVTTQPALERMESNGHETPAFLGFRNHGSQKAQLAALSPALEDVQASLTSFRDALVADALTMVTQAIFITTPNTPPPPPPPPGAGGNGDPAPVDPTPKDNGGTPPPPPNPGGQGGGPGPDDLPPPPGGEGETPEPATLVSAGIGLASLWAWRNRRRKQG